MPASSPYTGNDYQAVSNYRPYRLPINAVAQAITAQDRFWEMGAQRVKSVYDNALNLSLTSNENKVLRNQFMMDAEKQITKLSTMNLADPSVQRQGFGIFKPIFQDDAVMQDDYLTNLQGKIVGEADRFRKDIKSKGAGYSATNLGYALDGFQKFNSKTSRSQIGDVYNSLKGKQYEPYYDYRGEFSDIVKGCKGMTTQNPEAGTDYLLLQSGASDTRLQGCLSSSLSDKAKRQIEIEGYMSFKNPDGSINYNGLADAYSSRFSTMSQALKTNSDTIQGRITALEQEYQKAPTDEVKKQIDFEKGLLTQNAGRYNNLIDTQKSINTGDKNFVDQNFEVLSGSVYKDSIIDSFSEAYRNDTYKYIPDAVKLQADRFTFTSQENEANRLHDIDMENLKSQHDLMLESYKQNKKLKKNSDGTLSYDIINQPYTSANKTELANGRADFQNKYAATKQEGIDEMSNFYNAYVKNDWEAKGKLQAEFFDTKTGQLSPGAMEYMKTKDMASSEDLLEFYNRVMPINAELKVMDAEDAAIQERVRRENPELYNRGFLQNIQSDYKPINIGNTSILASDVQDALEGKSAKLKIVPGSGYTGAGAFSNDYNQERVYINDGGKWRELSGKEIRNTDLNRLEQRVISANSKNTDAINRKENEMYGQTLLVQKNRVFADERNADKTDVIRNRVYDAVNRVGGENIKSPATEGGGDVKYVYTDPKTGEATLTVTGSTTNADTPSETKLIKALNDVMPTDKITDLHVSGNTITVKIQSPQLVDQEVAGNPYLRVENALRGMEYAINQSNLPVGLRMDRDDLGARQRNHSIVIDSPVDNMTSYKAVPFKDTDGQIKWDVLSKWTGETSDTNKKGQYYMINLGNRRSARGMSLSQVISLINNSNVNPQ